MGLKREGQNKGDEYATSSSQTHYGKGSIRRGSTKEDDKYAEGWERIFGKQNKQQDG